MVKEMLSYLYYTAQIANYAPFILFFALLAAALPAKWEKKLAIVPINKISASVFGLIGAVAMVYVLYPNFRDHVEPSMATLGVSLLKGEPLYPSLDDYTFHGLLYGPLLSEIQAGALFVGVSLAGLPVIISSKLAGVLAFGLASLLFTKATLKSDFARTYCLLFLIPFGIFIFWNRIEPVLLLLVSLCLWATVSCSLLVRLLIVAVSTGLAAGLKLHGFLYTLPIAFIFIEHQQITPTAILAFVVTAIISFLLLFTPENISLFSFIDYIILASKHGLSAKFLRTNLLYLLALWSPLFVALVRTRRLHELSDPRLILLGVFQIVVCVIGAKPGAGIHHLLPFIPTNAIVFARYISAPEHRVDTKHGLNYKLIWMAALLPGLLVMMNTTLFMARDWKTYDQASRELNVLQKKYPDLVMGVAGDNTYRFSFFRATLEMNGVSQVDYSSYMDLQFAGVPDRPLIQAFGACVIKHMVIPKNERPFSMVNFYTSLPLFSDGLRESFDRSFVKVGNGKWYDTYECIKSTSTKN